MLLPNQLFDRIVGVSGSTNSEAKKATVLPVGCRRASERRTATRIAIGHRAQICRDSGKKAGVWDTVMLQDISPQGIGCLCQQAMETGATFVMKIVDNEGETIRIRCSVRRCEKGGFGNTAFLVGATFEQVIQQAQLRLNEEPGDLPRWQEAAETDRDFAPSGNRQVATKATGSAVARMAAHFFSVWEPIRAASHWMRRCDDFS